MPATTPRGFPYPLGTDPVSDGDDAIKALAQAVDTKVGAVAAGSGIVNVTVANTAASITVTFPVGRFTAAPFVVANSQNPSPLTTSGSASGISATGCTLYGNRTTVGTLTVQYVAVQQ